MNKYLKNLLEDVNIPVVFDYDGVLFEARWYEERINMRNETDELLLEAMKRGENLKTAPIGFMLDWVKTLKNDLFVLSFMHNDIEYSNKKRQVAEFYPSIPEGNVIMATSPENKIIHLEKIREQYGSFIYIDDNHPALMRYENHFGDECKFFHVSSLYV